MVNRSLKTIALVAGTLSFPWLLTAATQPANANAASLEVTAMSMQPEPEVRIEWVLRSKDLGSCVTAAPNLRRAVFEHGTRVRIVAVAVDADTAVVRSYLRRERLFRVEVKPISEREFQTNFAHYSPRPAVTPMLRVVPLRTSQFTFASYWNSALTGDRQGSAELLSRLATFLQPAEKNRPSTSISVGGGE